MADPLLSDQVPPNPNPNVGQEELDSLPIPPLDPFFLAIPENFGSNLPLTIDDNYEFDISLDDVNFDDLFSPSENETLNPLILTLPNETPDYVPSVGVSGDQDSVVEIYLNSSQSQAGSCNSGDGGMDSRSPVSSQGSGNVGPGGQPQEGMNVNVSSPDSGVFVVDQKIKIENENARNGVTKRKKESRDDANGEVRNHKYHRLENDSVNASSLHGSLGSVSEEEERKRARLLRNRESAQLSRQRKKHYVEELEEKLRAMHSTIADLNGKVSFFMAENASLRQQLSGNGMHAAPMYPPMAPVPYPWVPCPPYVVKPQGSQVPLVPIPRLKTQQPVSAVKNKKGESKKTEGKTKKVASVSFLGLLFFIMLFGGLVPLVNVKFGGGKENSLGLGSQRFYDQHRGRILVVNKHSNASQENTGVDFTNKKFDVGSRVHCERGSQKHSEHELENKGGTKPSADGFSYIGNGSEPLFASLYVPRNDKLVKIDGNLIIHSILASEKAITSRDNSDANRNKETGLAIPRDMHPALAIPEASSRVRHPHLYRGLEQQKALTSGSDNTLKDHFRSSAADGKMQQWFRQGLVGPMLSSGMCTEVFQFDVSPTGGAIVPTSSVTNITTEQQHNATKASKGRSRRTLRGLRDPFRGPKLNATGEPVRRNSRKADFQGNKTISSTVVSILVDPRDAGEIEVDGMIRTKSLSRIFVVMLLDSVKYVTYSCVLPHAGPHLVTT